MRKRLKKKRAKKQALSYFSYELFGDEDSIINEKVFEHPNSPFTAEDFKEAMQKMLGHPYPKPQAFFSSAFIPFDLLNGGPPLRCICEECTQKRLRAGGMFNAETT